MKQLERRWTSGCYRLILVGFCAVGLYLNSGLPEGRLNYMTFAYYTILSNLVCLVFFLPLACYSFGHKWEAKGLHSFYKGGVTLAITVTLIIYHVLLAPRQFSMGSDREFWRMRNILPHYVVPLMVIGDWLLFDRNGRFGRWYPVGWMGIPLVYFAFALVRAELGPPFLWTGSRYPYYFIDVDALGWHGVLVWACLIALFVLLLGYAYVGVDRLLGKIDRQSG